MSSRQSTRTSQGPMIWPLILVVIGAGLLLNNFLVLNNIELLDLWPLIPVLFGAQILLKGDLLPDSGFRTFGITRGNIESATLEISSGEIDVNLRALQTRNTERLIAGQYAYESRPALAVTDVHAQLKMNRGQTPWLSFADWEAGLSRDLPWQLVITSYLGQITANLSDVVIQNTLISTGIGDIHLTVPAEAFEPLYARSILGNIVLVTPEHFHTRITVDSARFFHVHFDDNRYDEIEPGVFMARDADEELPLVDIIITGTFGDAYLT